MTSSPSVLKDLELSLLLSSSEFENCRGAKDAIR